MNWKSVFFPVLLLISFCLSGQERYRLVAYNVENLFDTSADTVCNDKDFTPRGRLRWTYARYTDKLQKLSRVIAATGEGSFPSLIGLCEVENRKVVEDLITKTVLADADYGIIHYESPDFRGIDVAFLYDKKCFCPLNTLSIPVKFPEEPSVRTRDILYVSGILGDTDTLHFFICHFPSMSGGESVTEWKRVRAAEQLKQYIDSIKQKSPETGIVILGDLNGKADRPAQKKVLGVKSSDHKKISSSGLYNTGYYLLKSPTGSYKYQGEWQTIDHIIVSGNLLNGSHSFQTERRMKIFRESSVLEEDKRYFGYKPYRTYVGPRYNGGVSDHLPVYLDFMSNRETDEKSAGRLKN